MSDRDAGLVVWDVDGTLIPADLRWLRRAIAGTYQIEEDAIVFPASRVHGFTDESIVVETAISSGIDPERAEAGVAFFRDELTRVMRDGRNEFARVQPPYTGALQAISSLHEEGFVQTVLTGNLRSAAEFKLSVAGLAEHIDFSIGGFGSDARDRFALPEIIAERFATHYGHSLDRSRTVVIGDAPNDIACARFGGFHVLAVAHRISREELIEHNPDAVLDDLAPEAVTATVKSLVGPPQATLSI